MRFAIPFPLEQRERKEEVVRVSATSFLVSPFDQSKSEEMNRMKMRMGMRMNTIAMLRSREYYVAGEEIRRTAEVRIRKISIG